MEIERIIIGSWFPRTKLHLKEFFAFLKNGSVHYDADNIELSEIHHRIRPRNVLYLGGRFDQVTAEFEKIKLVYHEDGLLTLSVESNDFVKSHEQLINTYRNDIATSLSLIFGRGAPILSYEIPDAGQRPIILLAVSKI
jgi:hypothetical protein